MYFSADPARDRSPSCMLNWMAAESTMGKISTVKRGGEWGTHRRSCEEEEDGEYKTLQKKHQER